MAISNTEFGSGLDGATSRTQAGESALDVTQLATGGTPTGDSAAQLDIVAGGNETLDLGGQAQCRVQFALWTAC